MTERVIQEAIWRAIGPEGRKHQHLCPNYTPAGWLECDMFSVTAGGLMCEFEIKISRADFKNDAKKSQQFAKNGWHATRSDDLRTKHDRLLGRDTKGPSRFWYVCPEGLLKPEEIPEWAGLMYCRRSEGYGRCYISEQKPAPKLHKTVVADNVIEHVKGVFYWRFWGAMSKEQRKNDKNYLHES